MKVNESKSLWDFKKRERTSDRIMLRKGKKKVALKKNLTRNSQKRKRV